MTTGIHTAITEAVKDALNAAALSESFTATRVFIPDVELPTSETGTVVRVWPDPEGRTSKFETRSRLRRQYPVLVAVLRRCDVGLNSAVDPYIQLLEEIEDLFSGKQLTGNAAATCIGTEQVIGFSWEAMKRNRQYVGVVKLMFIRVS
jgi:hypothetical protein